MQLLHATVSKAPRQVSTKYGARVVCDVLLPDGSESAVWGPVGYAPLEYLERGQAVTVGKDSKGKISIVENNPMYPESEKPIPQLPQAAPETLNPDKPAPTMTGAQKREIASFVEEMGALYGFCYQTAAAKLPQDAPDAVRQACASSLFISAQRRFSLA